MLKFYNTLTRKKEIFKSYDIRGKYSKEINREIAYKLGRVFVEFLKKEKKSRQKLNILLGYDNRLSSIPLFRALSRGIIDQGANVFSLGTCSTPLFYFASKFYKDINGGIIITASHLSKEYNGFKLIKIKKIPIFINIYLGLKKIKDLFSKELKKPKNQGKMEILNKKNLLDEYLNFNLKGLNLTKIKDLKIIIDTGNAVTGIIIPRLSKKIDCQIFPLFTELDSHFPNRGLDCAQVKNLQKLQKEVLKRKANLGVAFDGDGDRIAFVDEKGKIISSNLIAALISEILLRDNPNQKIVYTVLGSRIISETIKKNKGIPIISEVGHASIKQKMIETQALFGAEFSGHYYLKNHYFCEVPFWIFLKLLELISQKNQTISQLIKPFKKYPFLLFEFKTKRPQEKILRLKKHFSDGKILEIDGLKVDYPDWGFSIRSSKTEENLLRIAIEAKTSSFLQKKVKIIKSLINFQ